MRMLDDHNANAKHVTTIKNKYFLKTCFTWGGDIIY